MARVTVEDCLARVPNRFALTILASRRARALSEGRGRALIECDNKEGVTALREVSANSVRFREDVDSALLDFIEEQRRQLRVTAGEHTFLEAASLRALEEDEGEADDDEAEVDELQADPEALNKQAASSEDDDTTEADADGDADFEEEGTFGEDDLPDDAAEIDAPGIGDDDAAGGDADETAAAEDEDD
ncbi:MAG: DNA-directed RNA polymerase subunit omega [Deltaproteobacteria bacterium]|nr:DNA-directed RNA polymerase subunit omega [Deltaproteobacteria bacterium]MBK8238481.1 DNA-directed RNA polymerase subunit omega [Deltaproteobacteria bacterium]MBK8717308.1 DNA-directed RNA polymerase subunit omega [Deltaproteobacteria bacterium]MBP7286176.1 DNA-directed RNA polymerase subunit omega [Nannocystaceae bacterium]